MIEFVVPGRPVPAVRMTQRSKWVDPQAQRYLEYKEFAGWIAKQAVKQKPITGQVAAKFRFYLKPKGRNPDLSNLIKAIEDALNKIVWKDDVQVRHIDASMIISKDEPERAEVIVREAEKEAS